MKSDILKQNSRIPIQVDLSDYLDNHKVILALGAELKANYCIIHKQKAYVYSGFNDLKIPEFFDQYKQSILSQIKKFKLKPQIITHDLNPMFLSSRLAEEFKNTLFKTSRIIPVQHHFAHIAAASAALGLSKNKKFIGIACDGTGLGNDQKVWGCEFISYDFKQAIRLGQLNYIPLPGSDKAVFEPWRVAVALLYMSYGSKLIDLPIAWIKQKKYEINILIQMIEKGINTPLASSSGRLFDGIAALIGLCMNVSSEAQAAIALEAQAAKAISTQDKGYNFKINKQDGIFVIDIRPMIKEIVCDLGKKQSIPIIAARFHNTFVEILKQTAVKISKAIGSKQVVLGGGVFLNKIVSGKLNISLVKSGLSVHKANYEFLSDVGLSLGQALLAGCDLNNK